jgi:DNA polymerase-3 subunit beta
MKFTVKLSDLNKALEITSPAMPKKSTLPILEHFNFQLKGNELKILATDQDLTIMTFLEVQGDTDGHILIPGKRISDIVKALVGIDEAEISTNDRYEIKIKTLAGKYSMKGIAPEEYLVMPELFESEKPDIESVKDSSVVDQSKQPVALFNREEIVRLAEKTFYAVSKDEYRLAMTGVLLQFGGEQVNAVATDSYRLVKCVTKPSYGVYPNDLKVIVPVRTVEQLKKADGDTAVSFIKTQLKITHIRFDINNTVIISRIIDEKFPPYESVLPKNNDIEVLLKKTEILSAIRRAAIFANASSNQIKLSFENNELKVIGEDEDTGSQGDETISCDFAKEPFKIGFNHKYLSEAINNVDDTEGNETQVLLTFSEPNRPALIKPTPDTGELVMLLMPVRIS